MKLSFLIFLLCIGFTASFSQTTDSLATQQFYSNRAKAQRTAALVLVGTGLAVTTYSIVHIFDNFLSSSNNAAAVGLLVGFGMELGGIALAFSSRKNRLKAKKFEAAMQLQNSSSIHGTLVQKVYCPSIAFKFHF